MMTNQIDGQISIFDLMDAGELRYSGPTQAAAVSNVLEPWDFHIGVKAWMMHAVWFNNGDHIPEWLHSCVVTFTDMWKSVEEPEQDNEGRWSTAGEKVRRKGEYYAGWYGGFRPLYRQTPTFDERLEYALKIHGRKQPRRIIDADCVVALQGPPLNEAEKETIRKLVFR